MLTKRQRRLLEIIIKEFAKSAEAVGSIDLPRKYELQVSPATVRNEMSRLSDMGYLEKQHASSGRVPTTLAFRYFLEELLDEIDRLDELDVRRKALLNEDLFQKRFNIDHMMLSAVKSLAELTNNASVALVEDKIYHSGLNYLLDNPEFQDLEVFKQILSIVEDYSEMSSILSRYKGDGKIRVLIGDEIGQEYFRYCAIVFVEIPLSRKSKAYLMVIGPNRMKYKKVLPSVKFVSEKIRSLISDWNKI
ncbi:hypothetical protein GF389_03850 [Candidatus Dojkabacteria bacterium]|nr:hypothetical protein [Candidatus Dojkabacteria bacterium]